MTKQCDEVPVLHADFENGEGLVSMPENWNWHSAIMRADLLKDWVEELTAHYDKAVGHLAGGQNETHRND